jgi:hypothetical protein
VVLGLIVKKQDAPMVLTPPNQREVGVTKQIAGRFRHREEEVPGRSKLGMDPLRKSAPDLRHLDVPGSGSE